MDENKTTNAENESNDELEKLFEDFIKSIQALPKEDLDKMYDNIKKMED